jgi:chaperonin GroEL
LFLFHDLLFRKEQLCSKTKLFNLIQPQTHALFKSLLSFTLFSLLSESSPTRALQHSPPQCLLHIVVDGQALAVCILTKIHGQLSVSAIKSPSFGYNRTSILGDLGLLTGVTVFSDDLEIKLSKATHDLLGSTDSIPKQDSIFLNGDGGNAPWSEHCSVIPQ